MKAIVIVIMLTVAPSTCSIACPTSWSVYRKVEDGPWLFSVPINKFHSVNFTIIKTTRYQCLHRDVVRFKTARKLNYGMKPKNSSSAYRFTSRISMTCVEKCHSLAVNETLFYQYHRRFAKWSEWLPLDVLTYEEKNCDKLYWSTWTQTSNCTLSSHIRYVRLCLDCDENEIARNYCIGSTTKQNVCRPIWSEWSEMEPCIIIGCNKTGNRFRRRKCLYGDGSEASNAKLCSNQSSVITETCFFNGTKCEKKPDHLHIGFYIAIAALGFIIFVFSLASYFFRKRFCSQDSNQRQTSPEIRLHIEHHIYNVIQEHVTNHEFEIDRFQQHSNRPSNQVHKNSTTKTESQTLVNQSNGPGKKFDPYSYARDVVVFNDDTIEEEYESGSSNGAGTPTNQTYEIMKSVDCIPPNVLIAKLSTKVWGGHGSNENQF